MDRDRHIGYCNSAKERGLGEAKLIILNHIPKFIKPKNLDDSQLSIAFG